MDPSIFRFYSSATPSCDDLVMVKVTKVTSMGAYVTLLEYGESEGMLVPWEITKTRIRSIHQLVKEGQIMSCLVLRVDPVKGYIDLSKRRVTPEDDKRCVAKYSRAKVVHTIIMRAATLLGYTSDTDVYELYSKTAWYLDSPKQRSRHRGGAFRTFYSALRNPQELDLCPVDESVKSVLLSVIQTRLQEKQVCIKACISVTCFGPDGVDAIKESLKDSLQLATQEFPLKIRYHRAPMYLVTLDTTLSQVKAAQEVVEAALSRVQRNITKYEGGGFAVTDQPTIVGRAVHEDEGDDDEEEDDEDNGLLDYDSCEEPEDDERASAARDDASLEENDTEGDDGMSLSQTLEKTYVGDGPDSGLGRELTDQELSD